MGLNTNVSIDPSSNSQSSQQITNNIIVKTNSAEEIPVIERSIEINEEPVKRDLIHY